VQQRRANTQGAALGSCPAPNAVLRFGWAIGVTWAQATRALARHFGRWSVTAMNGSVDDAGAQAERDDVCTVGGVELAPDLA